MHVMRIFIADDSAAIRERLVKLLSSIRGVEVVGVAIDGVETMLSVRKTKPDLVILDLQMPTLSGLEILPEIKEMSPSPIVMVLTNFSSHPHRGMCAKLGADYFFDKSTEFEKAIKVIENMA